MDRSGSRELDNSLSCLHSARFLVIRERLKLKVGQSDSWHTGELSLCEPALTLYLFAIGSFLFLMYFLVIFFHSL